MSTGTHPSSAETGDEPQDQAESHTEQNAGGQWKIKRGVLAFMNDVTGQVAQPERKLSAKIKKCADKRENARNKEQCPSEFSQWIHLCACDLRSVRGPKRNTQSQTPPCLARPPRPSLFSRCCSR